MPKIIKDGVAYGDGVMVDTALDATSENPVQNKVITGEINQINTSLTDKADKNNVVGFFGSLIENIGALTVDRTYTPSTNEWIQCRKHDSSSATQNAAIVIGGTTYSVCTVPDQIGYFPVKAGVQITLKGASNYAPRYSRYSML